MGDTTGLTITRVPIDSLTLDPANARTHPDENPRTGQSAPRSRARVTVHCPDCKRSRHIRRDSFDTVPPRCRSCSNRNVAYDDLSTVVTVCPKHHALLEPATRRISGAAPEVRRWAAFVILGLLGDIKAIHCGRHLAEGRIA